MNKVFIMGDIHGQWQPVKDFYERNKNKEIFDGSDVIILLGDAGLNYFLNDRDKQVKKKLGKYPFTYFVIRGNHEQRPSICAEENPDKWSDEIYFESRVYVENDYPYIKYASDGPEFYFINGYSILSLPGAYSVDKHYRLAMGYSWFEKEQLSELEMERGRDMVDLVKGVDIVLSHTCPIIFEPTDLFLSIIDQSSVDKTMERYLGEIEYKLDYRAWFWGHYHAFRDYPRTDGRKKLMLFNDKVIELADYLENEEFEVY